jgi:hypothetical protein
MYACLSIEVRKKGGIEPEGYGKRQIIIINDESFVPVVSFQTTVDSCYYEKNQMKNGGSHEGDHYQTVHGRQKLQ